MFNYICFSLTNAYDRRYLLIIRNLKRTVKIENEDKQVITVQYAFYNKRSHGTKSAMLEGKLTIIPALEHQSKGKSSFFGSGLFVLMSQCGNNNELALQHGGFCTM